MAKLWLILPNKGKDLWTAQKVNMTKYGIHLDKSARIRVHIVHKR